MQQEAKSQRSIMLMVNWLDFGGAEVQVVRLAVGLRGRGWRVSVVSMLTPGPLAKDLAAAEIPVHCLKMRPGVPNPIAMLRLRSVVRRERPDVLHSHIVHANLLARATRLMTRIRVLVCTAHNVQEGGRLHELAYRYTDPLADLTTNVSQAAVDRYIQIKAAPAGRIRFVPNGLDISRFRKSTDDRDALRRELGLQGQFAWLAIGRLSEQKDYPNMLRAFAATLSAAPDSVLLIAGTGELEGEIRGLATTLGVADRVRLLGVRSDAPALMNTADCYLLSSAWEGMPLVLQEAGASELPVVATRVGGNAEVVRDESSGFLVPPRDDRALAAAMKRMMALSNTERSAMGQAGRQFIASRFDMERVLDQWEGIYDELMSARPMSK